MTNCLVTGANGFLGRHLTGRLLAEGYEVATLTKDAAAIPDVDENITCDIRDLASLGRALSGKKFDFVFHCAARIPPVPDATKECLETNSLGTYNLLFSLKDAGIRRFVYSSSMEAYGNSDGKMPVREDAPCLPGNPYGLSKLFGESACGLFRDFFGITILRYSGIFGPGKQRGLVYNALASLKNRTPLKINGNGLQHNDYVWINDVVGANLLCLKLKERHGIYNIGGGKAVKALDVAGIAQEVAGMDGKTVVERPDSRNEPRLWLDIGKARRRLGYCPTDFKKAVAIFYGGL